MGCIAKAREEGGTILCGGNALQPEGRCANGWFIEPTVIEGVGPGSVSNQEEIFGPVVTLQKFNTEEEALQLAQCHAIRAGRHYLDQQSYPRTSCRRPR